MVAIQGSGVYIPSDRIHTDEITALWNSNPGDVVTKSVPGKSEDPVTMSREAAKRALAASGTSAENLGSIFFCSMSLKQTVSEASATLSAMLDAEEAFTTDLRGSARTGVGGIILADQFGGPAPQLVVAVDAPRGGVGTGIEAISGGAAVAFVLSGDGPDHVMNALSAASAFSPEHRRADGRWDTPDPRFGRARYREQVADAFAQLEGDVSEAYEHVILQGPPGRSGHGALGEVGVDPRIRRGEDVVRKLGDIGTPTPLLGLARVLSDIDDQESALVLGYGNGYHLITIDVAASVPVYGSTALEGDGTLTYPAYLKRTGQLESKGRGS
jgi:3-hydroxy-3-methylglutaryl CoA synthase